MRAARAGLLLLICLTACDARPQHAPRDESGDEDATHPRIVTLAPHLAELVFDVGAGELLVGVSAYTDYPQAAAALPVVSDAFLTDQERLAMLHPDLLLAWESGTPAHVVDDLHAAGYSIEVMRTRSLGDIADALLKIGRLTGHENTAATAAETFRQGLARLSRRGREAKPIRVFYQISERPLYTVSGDHYVSELITMCGGVNIFADLRDLAPLVSVEAVLERDPEAMLAGGYGQENVFDEWRRFRQLAANRYGNHFLIAASEISRPTPRLLRAGEAICNALDEGRRNRAGQGAG